MSEQDQGVTASPPGCQPSASAAFADAPASSQSGIPNAEALVRLMDDYQNIPAEEFRGRYPAFVAMRDAHRRKYGRTQYDTSFEIFLAIAEDLASAMSAGTAETAQQAQGQRPASAVPKADAQDPSPLNQDSSNG